MFRGDHHRLYREEIAKALGIDLVPTTQVHELCYLGAVAPCHALFKQPFSPNSLRSLGELTQLAVVLLLTFKKSLYPRSSFGEAITVMQ